MRVVFTTRVTWADGLYVSYSRDAAEEVTAILENGSTSLASYVYDDLGERITLNRGNGVVTTYGFDGLSRLNALTHTLAYGGYNQGLAFTRNAAGQITARTMSDNAYDWTGAYAATRSYNPDGLNRLTTSGPYSLGYDARGNLTSDSLHSYSYSPTNQLTGYSSGGTGATLAYDPLGRLAQTSGAATTGLAYAGDQLIAEYGGSGALLRRYVPGPDGADDPIVWYEGSSTTDRRWLIDDERGSVIGITGAGGALMGSPNTYDEYGYPGGSNQGRFQYTGQLWIPEIGLYHYKARTYSPTIGRFMQTDPIGYIDDINMYAYAGNDPINGTDPSGMADGQAPVDEVTVLAQRTKPGITILGSNANSDVLQDFHLPGGTDGASQLSGVTVIANRNRSQKVRPRVLLGCASAFASDHSISAGMQAFGAPKFWSDVVGGNTVSGIHDLAATYSHGTGGGNSAAYNLAQAGLAGPALGAGGFFARFAPKIASSTGGVTDALMQFGGMALEDALVIGEAKAIYDGGTFGVGAIICTMQGQY